MTTVYYNNLRSRPLQQLPKARAGAWIHCESPTTQELAEIAELYGLEPSLLLDAIDPDESPRVEVEDGVTYIFTRFCYKSSDRIVTAPFLIVYSPNHLLTVTPQRFARLQRFTEQKVEFYTTQKIKFLLQLLAEIELSYTVQLNQISKHIWNIRSKLNKEQINNRDFIGFIDIEETLNDFLSALVPTNAITRKLLSGRYFKLYEEDEELIEDLSLGLGELIDLTKSRLKTIVNIREAYSTIMANNLNRIFKFLTSITILMTVPTIISSIYGMNVRLPMAESAAAFWLILALIAAVVLALVMLFRQKRWF
jgi:magnesium transporter